VNPRPTAVSATLTLAGVALVVWWTVTHRVPALAPWSVAAGCVAAAAWGLRMLAARVAWRRTAVVLAIAGAVAGSLAAAATDGTSCLPAIVCVLTLVADDTLPIALGAFVALGALGLTAVGAVAHPVSVLQLLAMLGAVMLGVLGGFSRRQLRRSERQAAQLVEREAAAREEAARIAIARDLHDVLAHTLGGLVLQLDAVDALLEAGDDASARARVASARELAGSGLGEARRAVSALRAPGAPASAPDVSAAALQTTLDALIDAHRSLGGVVAASTTGTPFTLGADQALAIERALQESLSNARRHAAGRPVTVAVDWQDDGVRLTVANPAPGAAPVVPSPAPDAAPVAPRPAPGAAPVVPNPAPDAAPHGPAVASAAPSAPAARRTAAASDGAHSGYGLVGMRERFAALPGGGTVTAGIVDGCFTVTAEASR
jgi:signal transduction histidine kinase